MPRNDLVVLTTVRSGARGALRRLDTWTRIAEAAGRSTKVLRLGGGVHFERRQLAAVARGEAVPEHLSWSLRGALRLIDAAEPGMIVSMTSRAYHPSFSRLGVPFVLDLVDSLADSYRQRAQLAVARERIGYRALAQTQARFEGRIKIADIQRTVAGYGDADRFSAEWIPMVVDRVVDEPWPKPSFDLVFFGTLSYGPNIAAVVQLARWWDDVAVRCGPLRVLIAGSRPVPQVDRLCREHGWMLQPNFDDVAEICRSARVAVAPLPAAAGQQIKVLDAANAGVPQIVTTPVLQGLDPNFPLIVADTAGDFADAVYRLCRAPDAEVVRSELAERAQRHVRAHYVASRYSSVVVPCPTSPGATAVKAERRPADSLKA